MVEFRTVKHACKRLGRCSVGLGCIGFVARYSWSPSVSFCRLFSGAIYWRFLRKTLVRKEVGLDSVLPGNSLDCGKAVDVNSTVCYACTEWNDAYLSQTAGNVIVHYSLGKVQIKWLTSALLKQHFNLQVQVLVVWQEAEMASPGELVHTFSPLTLSCIRRPKPSIPDSIDIWKTGNNILCQWSLRGNISLKHYIQNVWECGGEWATPGVLVGYLCLWLRFAGTSLELVKVRQLFPVVVLIFIRIIMVGAHNVISYIGLRLLRPWDSE